MIVATRPEPTVRPPSRSSDMIMCVVTSEKSLVIFSKHAVFSLHFTQFLIFKGQSWVTHLFSLSLCKSFAAFFFVSATISSRVILACRTELYSRIRLMSSTSKRSLTTGLFILIILTF